MPAVNENVYKETYCSVLYMIVKLIYIRQNINIQSVKNSVVRYSKHDSTVKYSKEQQSTVQ